MRGGFRGLDDARWRPPRSSASRFSQGSAAPGIPGTGSSSRAGQVFAPGARHWRLMFRDVVIEDGPGPTARALAADGLRHAMDPVRAPEERAPPLAIWCALASRVLIA